MAPGLEVSIEMAHTQGPVAALHADAIDVALLTTGRMRGAGFVEQALFSDEVVFVVARRHALASKMTSMLRLCIARLNCV